MIREQLLEAVESAMSGLGVESLPPSVVIEQPTRREHGDWSTNAALVSSKIAGRNPRELGQALLDALDANPPPHVSKLELAGPGFVNFHLAPTWLHDVISDVIAKGEDGFGRLNLSDGRKINLEFVSANPTGPIHAGGGRWGAYGDSLARILRRTGHEVFTEFYVNDRGVQTKLFGKSLTAAKNGEPTPEDGYKGAYIDEWAAEMPDDVDPIKWGIERSLRDGRDVLAEMHVTFDRWSSEAEAAAGGAMESALEELRSAGYVFEEGGATWLRTTDFGDDLDRVLIKSDGEPSYFLPDIAYHRNKFDRGDLVIDMLGADHHGYIKRMSAAMQALGKPEDSYEVIIGQFVKLIENGVEVKISKRAGTLVEIRDLIDAVGPDVARFAYLLQSIDSGQTLDLDLLKAQATENPVYYVQYANARIHSITRQASKRGIERRPLAEVDLSTLTHERELDLARQLFAFDDVIELAVNGRAPHKVTTWVRELAADFHRFYHDCPVLRDDVDPELAQARLWLTEASRIGLSTALDLLGVDAPSEM